MLKDSEVTIKLNGEHREKIKKSTGSDVDEVRIDTREREKQDDDKPQDGGTSGLSRAN